MLKTTPAEHDDHVPLNEALRLSRSFLAGVNESFASKREVTLSHGMVRQGPKFNGPEQERQNFCPCVTAEPPADA